MTNQAVLDVVAVYAPAHVSRAVWGVVATPVRAAVVEAAVGDTSARAMLSRVAGFAAWLDGEGIAVGLGSLTDPELIERYVAVGMDGAASSTRATTRAILRRVAARIDPPGQPGPQPMAYRRVREPYARWEVDGFLRAARTQPSAARRHQALALLALGLGCGLDARDLSWVRGSDVSDEGDGAVLVTVSGGTRPRTVPALTAYASTIAQSARAVADGLMIGGTMRGRRNVTSYALERLVPDRDLPRLVMGRLRSTWLLTHVNLATPLPTLMRAAGLTTVRPLEDLLGFAEPIDDAVADRFLRGWSA